MSYKETNNGNVTLFYEVMKQFKLLMNDDRTIQEILMANNNTKIACKNLDKSAVEKPVAIQIKHAIKPMKKAMPKNPSKTFNSLHDALDNIQL